MTNDFAEMINEDLLRRFEDASIKYGSANIGSKEEIDADAIGEAAKAELLRRLASAVPAGLRCSHCGKDTLKIIWQAHAVFCSACEFAVPFGTKYAETDLKTVCAQFFAPSPATPRPDLHVDLDYVFDALIATSEALACSCNPGTEDGPCPSCQANHASAIIDKMRKASPATGQPPQQTKRVEATVTVANGAPTDQPGICKHCRKSIQFKDGYWRALGEDTRYCKEHDGRHEPNAAQKEPHTVGLKPLFNPHKEGIWIDDPEESACLCEPDCVVRNCPIHGTGAIPNNFTKIEPAAVPAPESVAPPQGTCPCSKDHGPHEGELQAISWNGLELVVCEKHRPLYLPHPPINLRAEPVALEEVAREIATNMGDRKPFEIERDTKWILRILNLRLGAGEPPKDAVCDQYGFGTTPERSLAGTTVEEAMLIPGGHNASYRAGWRDCVEKLRPFIPSQPPAKECGCVCHKVGLFGLMCCPCTKKALDELVNGKPSAPVTPVSQPRTHYAIEHIELLKKEIGVIWQDGCLSQEKWDRWEYLMNEALESLASWHDTGTGPSWEPSAQPHAEGTEEK